MRKCIRCIISGRVQGVWFRASTQRQAQPLKISGYAKNLPDGQVEVVACGEPGALARLKSWLHVGPSMAHVTTVTCESIDDEAWNDFTTE